MTRLCVANLARVYRPIPVLVNGHSRLADQHSIDNEVTTYASHVAPNRSRSLFTRDNYAIVKASVRLSVRSCLSHLQP